MSAPRPPVRQSSLRFSESQREQHKAATLKRKRAQKSRESLKSWNSSDYWQFRKEEGDATLEIMDIEWEALKAGFAKAEDIEQGEREYQDEKAKILQQNEAAVRKIDRFLKREAVLSANSTKNPVSTRASFVELMLSIITKTTRAGQGHLINDLELSYGKKKVGKVRLVWCSVTGDWEARSSMKAAHLFPLSLGQKVMSYVFGEDSANELNSARNGLFLPHAFEEAFDKYQVVLVPAENESTPMEWQILVLDRSGLWNVKVEGRTFGDRHGDLLIFPPGNNFRPRARYLYFHYLVAMLKISHGSQVEKSVASKQYLEATVPRLAKVWGTQGRYLRENMIRGFIESMGHELLSVDATSLLENAAKDRPDEQERMVHTAEEADLLSDPEDSDDDDDF